MKEHEITTQGELHRTDLHSNEIPKRRWFYVTPHGLAVGLFAFECQTWLSQRQPWFSFFHCKGWAPLAAAAAALVVPGGYVRGDRGKFESVGRCEQTFGDGAKIGAAVRMSELAALFRSVAERLP